MKKTDFDSSLLSLSQFLSIDLEKDLKSKVLQKIAQCGDVIWIVKGDLSGIQSYLYNVNRAEDVDGKVAKRLRGRSFYLSALCHAFSYELGQRFGRDGGKPDDVILLAAGGKFIVVLPGAPVRELDLDKWKKEIDLWLWQQTWGEIFLNLAYIKCSSSDFETNFSAKVALPLQSQLDLGKSQKYQALFAQGQTETAHGNRFVYPVFNEDSPKAYPEECHSCNSLPAHGEASDQETYIESSNLCLQCNLHQYIAGYWNLPKHNYVKIYPNSVAPRLAKVQLQFHDNYVDLQSYPAGDSPRVPSFVPVFPYQSLPNAKRSNGLAEAKIDELCDFCPIHKRDEQKDEPECGVDDERLATRFHCLATLAQRQGGAAKIAVLAIDGDDFSFHLNSTPDLTLVDHIAMGKLIYQFFADHLIKLLERYDCYLVYSGGDDLVVVGPWASVYEVADKLYQDFKHATQGELHFSAGLHVTNPQSPIYESIQHALDLLKQAKAHRNKNAIQLMSTTVPWTKFAGVMEFAKELADAEKSKIISTGFIYGLYRICEQYELYRDEGNINGLRFLGWLASHLNRNLRQEWPDDPQLQTKATVLLNKLRSLLTSTELKHDEGKLLPYLRAALDWAALKNRES